MSRGVIAAWCVACLLWSSTFLFIRIGLREIPPFTFAWVRLAIALAVMAPVAIMRGDIRKTPARDVLRIAAAGLLLLGANYGLVFWGAQFVPSGLVAILLSGTPILALAFGWVLGSERVTARKALSLALALGGVIAIFGSEARTSRRDAIAGTIAVFAASACIALAYVWIKGYGRRLSPLSVTAVQSAAAMIVLGAVAVFAEGLPEPARWSPVAWGALGYLALGGSVFALWLNYWLLQRMDASAMLMMGVAEVPIAVALGAVFLGERLPPGTLVGAASVLAGVTAVLADPRQGTSS
jgi:drug/metabolite transporter (DMT)-like permease